MHVSRNPTGSRHIEINFLPSSVRFYLDKPLGHDEVDCSSGYEMTSDAGDYLSKGFHERTELDCSNCRGWMIQLSDRLEKYG
jgi:hypothetical protein